MFVINTSIPDPHAKVYQSTRLVIGCEDHAAAAFEALRNCGYYVDISEVVEAPERPEDERKRAAELLTLLFTPAMGNA